MRALQTPTLFFSRLPAVNVKVRDGSGNEVSLGHPQFTGARDDEAAAAGGTRMSSPFAQTLLFLPISVSQIFFKIKKTTPFQKMMTGGCRHLLSNALTGDREVLSHTSFSLPCCVSPASPQPTAAVCRRIRQPSRFSSTGSVFAGSRRLRWCVPLHLCGPAQRPATLATFLLTRVTRPFS